MGKEAKYGYVCVCLRQHKHQETYVRIPYKDRAWRWRGTGVHRDRPLNIYCFFLIEIFN